MTLAETIPGMSPGCPVQNLLVGLVYLVCLTVVLPVVALTYRPFRGC